MECNKHVADIPLKCELIKWQYGVIGQIIVSINSEYLHFLEHCVEFIKSKSIKELDRILIVSQFPLIMQWRQKMKINQNCRMELFRKKEEKPEVFKVIGVIEPAGSSVAGLNVTARPSSMHNFF